MNVYIGTYSRLPSTYQEVKYIQSTGTQYIDTGYIPSNNTKIGLKMSDWSRVGTYCEMFGARYNWSSSGRGFVMGKDYSNGPYFVMFNGSYNESTLLLDFDDGRMCEIEMSQDGVIVNGSLKKTFSSTTFTSPGNLYIFAGNNNGSTIEQSSYKLYSCKIYNSGTLVRDFVPCYRKSDSVIGLYDLENSVFYTNAGTGTFTKGNDVKTFQAELKNAYIGEVADCDFTTGDYGFTFYGRTTTRVNYGRDSNGLYVSETNNLAGAAWKIPSSIYSRGTIKKIEFKFYSTTAGCGGGISYQTDTQFSRIWTSGVSGATGFDNNWGTHSNTPVTTPAGGYTFTIDLENKLLSASFTNTTFSLSNNDVSTIRNYWSNGNLNILGVITNTGTVTGYIQRATFYF